jgi:modulator of FtsH protease HflC
MRIAVAVAVLIVGLAIAGIYAAAFIVHQNEQALVLRFGDPSVRGEPITQPGLHWKWPLIDTVEYFDRRILDLDTQAQEVTASDQKRIVVDAFARYRITDPLLFYQTIRDERNVRSRLGPIMESALRRVLGAATFQDLVRDRREELMHRIAQQVNAEGKDFGLEVVDVRIKRADLPEQNSKSVFERMRAERFREAAEFRAQGAAEANRIKATADREATVIKAEASRKAEQTRGEGDGERNRIFAEAFGRDADFFGFYRSMQAYEQGLKSGDTRLVISPDSEFFRYFSNPDGQGSGTAPGSNAAAAKAPPATAAVPQAPAQPAPPARP